MLSASLLRAASAPSRVTCANQLLRAQGTRQYKTKHFEGGSDFPNRVFGPTIPHPVVRVVDPETGKLSETTVSLRKLLEERDPKTEFIELVSTDPEPIVKVGDRQAMWAQHKELKKKQSQGTRAGTRKEVQLTWGVAGGDLQHKLGKARKELEKGIRVDVAIAPKRGQKPPSPKDINVLPDEIVAALADVGECTARDVQKNVVVMSFKAKSRT